MDLIGSFLICIPQMWTGGNDDARMGDETAPPYHDCRWDDGGACEAESCIPTAAG